MGTWDATILGNDTSCEIRDYFIDYYNQGTNPKEIEELVFNENTDIFKYERTNAWFGLALACWECKVLTNRTLNEIENILETNADIKEHIKLGADKNFIKKREKYLNYFLIQISSEKKRAIRRKKTNPFIETEFKAGMCFSYKNKENKYIGIYLIKSEHEIDRGEIVFYFMDFEKTEIPNLDMFRNSKLYGLEKLGAEWGDYNYQGNTTNLNYNQKNKKYFFEIVPKTLLHIGDLPVLNDKVINNSKGEFMNFKDCKTTVEPIEKIRKFHQSNLKISKMSLTELITENKRMQIENH